MGKQDNRILTIKKLYLDPFIDMFNSENVSYHISKRPNSQAIFETQEDIEKTKFALFVEPFTPIKVGIPNVDILKN